MSAPIINPNELISSLITDLAVRSAERVSSFRLPARRDVIETQLKQAVDHVEIGTLADRLDGELLDEFLRSPDVAGMVERLLAFRFLAHEYDAEPTGTESSGASSGEALDGSKMGEVRKELERLRRGEGRTIAEDELDASRQRWRQEQISREAALERAPITYDAQEAALRREFKRTAELWFGAAATGDVTDAIFCALSYAANAAYVAIADHIVGRENLLPKLRRWLNSVEPRMAVLDSVPSVRPLLRFESELRLQAVTRHKWLKAPHLRNDRLDRGANYVEPRFRPWRPTSVDEELDAASLTRAIDRTVILGDPGAGKSSFASSLCYSVAACYEERLVAGRLLTPIMVTLRELAGDLHELSITDVLATLARTHYQVEPPDGAIAYLLAQGRLLIVFDGLDELLDVSERRVMRDTIEAFCDRYPMVHVLVTVRSIGYEHASLNESLFRAFTLQEFNTSQVSEYARRWFALEDEFTPEQQAETTSAFLRESDQHAKDLRRNPLMLALLCAIYSGPGTLPTSRPAIYQSSIELLLHRWDALRRLEVSDPLEQHLERTLRRVADWLYSNPDFTNGIPESILVKRCAAYLAEVRTEDEDEAHTVAQSFVDFCRDRSWVLVKTGYTDDGESLFGFAHRTFLEYFAAQHLEKATRTPAELATKLTMVMDDTASVVPHLALQLANQSRDDAGDDVLTILIGDTEEESSDDRRITLLLFIVESLRYIIPKPRTTRRLAREAALGLLAPTLMDTTRHDGSREVRVWPLVAERLGSIALRNIRAASTGFQEGLQHTAYAKDARAAMDELLLGVLRQPCFVVDAWRSAFPALFESDSQM